MASGCKTKRNDVIIYKKKRTYCVDALISSVTEEGFLILSDPTTEPQAPSATLNPRPYTPETQKPTTLDNPTCLKLQIQKPQILS